MECKLFVLEIGENFIIYDCRLKRLEKTNIIMLLKANELITVLDFGKMNFKFTRKDKDGMCNYKLIDKKYLALG